jgi:cobalt-zinc-cadmium efflux system membrane fusion protein
MKNETPVETIYALVFAVCVLLALFLLTGCHPKPDAPAEPRPEVRGESVTFPHGTAAVERLAIDKVESPVERDLLLPGRLTWDEDRTVRVFPPFAGRVTRIIAKLGDRVSAGQPLVEMVSPDFGQAQADARKAQSDLALATKTLERQRELNAAGIVSGKDLQQAEADHARARAEADRALGRMSTYGQGAGSSANFVLRSPVAGTIVERNVNPGQELRPDQPGNPIFVVTDPTRLWVTIDASESDLRYLAAGMPIFISSNQFPEDAFSGTLRQLSDFVDPVARSLKLRGEVPNPNRTLKAEMFVSARLKVPKADEPTVNAKAVYLSGVRRYVFVRTNGNTFTRRPVRVGGDVNGRMPVQSGLREGDEVVIAGNLFLDQILNSARVVVDAEEPRTAAAK